jgi:hypothetical protein
MNDVNTIIQLANAYENGCLESLVKLAKIRKMPDGRYRVLSPTGKNLGTYKSQEAAKKRHEREEFVKKFDHSNAEDGAKIIDLTDIDEFSYSAIMRKVRAKCSPEQVRQFLVLYKNQFDRAVKGKLHRPERIALQTAMIKFNKLYKVKIDKKMIKSAAISELGNSEQVGQYLSDIVKFVLNRLPLDKRQHALDSLKQKFSTLSELDISSKVLPQSSALGQSITFVKTVLFNHDARYVREVLNSLVKHL